MHKEPFNTFKLYTRPSRTKPCRATAVTGLREPNTPAPMMPTWNKTDTISRPKWHCFASFESSAVGELLSTTDSIMSDTRISSKEQGQSTNNKVAVCMRSPVNAKDPMDSNNTTTTITDE